MTLPTRLSASVSLALLALAGCAHKPPPQVSTTTTTSALTTQPAARAPEAETLSMPPPVETYRPQTEKIQVASDAAIEEWSQRYPDASMQLEDWMQEYPSAAQRLASWNARHPIRMSTMVDWAVAHRFESIEAFFYGRSGWEELARIVHDDRDAVNELVDWMRRSPHAAEELTIHPDALGWMNAHLGEPTERVAKMRHHVRAAPHSVAAGRDVAH